MLKWAVDQFIENRAIELLDEHYCVKSIHNAIGGDATIIDQRLEELVQEGRLKRVYLFECESCEDVILMVDEDEAKLKQFESIHCEDCNKDTVVTPHQAILSYYLTEQYEKYILQRRENVSL